MKCNDISKLSDALRSRLTKFEFKAVSNEDMEKLLHKIAEKDGLKVPERVMNQIIRESRGIPREAVRKLNQYKILRE
ncbi:MAG: hypothetical protein ACYCT2_05810 [Thermoplasmataceae archaeon]